VHYKEGGDDGMKLNGYSDADLAGDLDERKSTSGVMFFLGNNPVTWQSAKQKVVALSSCEAEYIAAATATCQGVWLLGNSGKHITLETSKSNGIVKVCFSGAGNSRIQEVWDLRSLEFADVQSSGILVR
jgi:hypothetical protein